MTTILILDDNPVVLRMLGLVLGSKAGYRVIESGTESDAVSQIEQHLPDIKLLVADVCVDGEPGRTVAARLTKRCPHLRVLFISGYPHDHLIANGWLQPDDAFLAKPFSPDRLIRRVNEVLAVSPQQHSVSTGALRTACAGGAP